MSTTIEFSFFFMKTTTTTHSKKNDFFLSIFSFIETKTKKKQKFDCTSFVDAMKKNNKLKT